MPSDAKLSSFADWCQKHIVGDEKGQAQIFLDRLFQAFDHPGVFEAGGQTEFRIRKSDEDGGGTAFADLVWKPVVLIEMKKCGEQLQKHYRQAFDYWTCLVPNPLRDAHAALDAAVLETYGFNPKKDLLAQLLALNLEVAVRIECNEPVTAPGILPNFPNPQSLNTTDCIRTAPL
jgi:hypothetical protein